MTVHPSQLSSARDPCKAARYEVLGVSRQRRFVMSEEGIRSLTNNPILFFQGSSRKHTSNMPKSREPLKNEKRARTFYEHGMDGLTLALSIADAEEDKALRKVDKHRQTQEPVSRSGRQHRKSDKTSNLEKAKAMIAQQRARLKKEKAKSRKERSKRGEARASMARVTIPGPSGATPRKKVTFA